MLPLQNITLIAASSVELKGTELALRISSHEIKFGAIKFFSSEEWVPTDPGIEMVRIPRLDFWGYSRFIMCSLVNYVDTPFCLIVQADGFVLNAGSWSNEFLEYDYIGAPWPRDLILQPSNNLLDMRKNLVGNGGFSLRSKKFMEETSKIDFDSLNFPTKSEDLIVCHYLYEDLLSAGIKFPPPELAARFSVESPDAAYGQSPKTSFGFHGKKLSEEILGNTF